MFEKIIAHSVRNKLTVIAGVALMVAAGIWSLIEISVDAVPDITNNQVQIVTTSSSLAAEDVENLITYPIEMTLTNLPDLQEIRSISRYGLSIVTVVFDESVETMRARQFVSEQLKLAAENIPAGMGSPEMMPITTGLGEIYQYVLEVDSAYKNQYGIMDLRTIQDWLVKRQLAGIDGVIETSSFGGEVRQYEVSFYPEKLNALDLTIDQVIEAIEASNANTGGGYISRDSRAVYIRAEGMLRTLDEIGNIPVTRRHLSTVLVKDIADLRYGSALRYGAMTKDGKGETVGGITLMLKDANAKKTVQLIQERVKETQKTLPPGISIQPYLDRSDLVDRSISTVVKNLAEGGLLVTLILVFFLGNFRAGLLVASVIPLSMLFALILMKVFGVSANLMSLGAIDFGIVVDGAIIIVEGILHYLALNAVSQSRSRQEMDDAVIVSSSRIYGSAAFGMLIILVVFLPVIGLQGVEGKMFQPMALTLMFALTGALLLSLTYVPVMSTYLLRHVSFEKQTYGERIMDRVRRWYHKSLLSILPYGKIVIPITLILLALSVWRISTMGAVFLPELEEGDLAMQMAVAPGSHLDHTIAISTEVERTLLETFPEVRSVVSKIGTAEVPTDPMSIEDADVMILLAPKDEWTSAESREELVDRMKESLEIYPDVSFEFTQPIQLRFNELLTGSKADIAIKIFGDDTDVLLGLATSAEALINDVSGAEDIKTERTAGLQQLVVQYDREKMGWYGIHVADANRAIETAFAGTVAGMVADGDRRFDIVVRLESDSRDRADLSGLMVRSASGKAVAMSEVATLQPLEGAAMITRENSQRRINIGVNVRNRSLTDVVEDIQETLETNLNLPPGYTIRYEGEYQNYQQATARLAVALPIALGLILLLLYIVYRKWRYALLVFCAVPLSAIGGIWMLALRDMPFSISAGIGFIAVFGVSVLDGIVMISHINYVRKTSNMTLREAIVEGASDRLRPVLLTSLVATFGFIPMAFSASAGAEVQKPLATVVIGGIITATILTLIILPILYLWMESGQKKAGSWTKSSLTVVIITFLTFSGFSQESTDWEAFKSRALTANPLLEAEAISVEIEKAGIQTGWQIAPTEISYGYGELNRADISDDYQWNFTQEFGSIPEHINRKRSLEAAVDVSEAALERYKINFETDLMMDYLLWVYSETRMEKLSEQMAMLDSLDRIVGRQFDSGALTPSERYLFQGEMLQFRKTFSEAAVEATRIRQRLENRCLFPLNDLKPGEDALFAAGLGNVDTVNASLFYREQEAQLNLAEYRLKMQRAAFFPALSANYQRARLEGLPGADAVTVGIAIPIWYGPDKARVSQSALRIEQESARLSAIRFQSEAAASQAWQAYQVQSRLFHESGNQYRDNATQLMEKSMNAYRAGETDAYQALQSLTAATRLYLAYFDIAEAYGLARINLNRFQNR